MLIIGLIMVILGGAVKYWLSRRAFYRRGVGGLEEFNSFEKAVVTSLWEKPLHIISFLTIIIGVIVILVSFMS